MTAPVSPFWRVPRVGETYMGEPVLGRTATGIAAMFNHLNGVQARGFVPISVYQGPALTSGHADDIGYIKGDLERYETIYAPFYVPLGVDLVHVALYCLCYETGGPSLPAQSPTVTVTVEDASQVQFEDGCTWTRVSRDLPGDEFKKAGSYFMRPFLVESAPRFSSADPTAGSPSAPRRLSLGSKVGTVVVMKIASERARVVAGWLFPVPPDSL